MFGTYKKIIFVSDSTISSLSTPKRGDRGDKIILINKLWASLRN